MKKWVAGSLLILLFMVGAAAYHLGFFALPFSSIAGTQIQRVELTALNGQPHSFDELKGQDTVLYFFASWCLPCYKSMATIQQLSEQQQFNRSLIAVALDDDHQAVQDMLAKTGFRGEVWLVEQGNNALQRRYFGNEHRAVPYVVRLDTQTRIIEQMYSLHSAESWRAVLVDGRSLFEAGQVAVGD